MTTQEPLLSDEDIASRLKSLPGWVVGVSKTGKILRRNIQFGDFILAMKCVNQVAQLAEEQQHHPDIHISYNQVTFELSTHSAGGVTEKDITLAQGIQSIIELKGFQVS